MISDITFHFGGAILSLLIGAGAVVYAAVALVAFLISLAAAKGGLAGSVTFRAAIAAFISLFCALLALAVPQSEMGDTIAGVALLGWIPLFLAGLVLCFLRWP